MLRLDKVIKPWKESAALNDHINLYGFWNETTFLTKSGDVGMVLSVPGVDYESLDRSEQEYAVKRLEAALKAFSPGFHVYQYLFKSNCPDIPFAEYDDPVVAAAIDQRRQFFRAKRECLYQVEIFYCILLEGSRSKTGVGAALARLFRDPAGAMEELRTQFTSNSTKTLLRSYIEHDVRRLEQQVCALELLRRNDVDKFGAWPFEIGLWVGRAATPNRMGSKGDNDPNSARARTRKFWDSDKNPSPIPLEECPWCGTKFTRSSFRLTPNPDNPTNLLVKCVRPQCSFAGNSWLPIVAVDEPIYRRLPCFMIATVDKFAALPWTGEVGAFFGRAERHDSGGFYGPCDPLPGSKLPNGRLLPPDLIIQDELHLISGPLGTMVGLYETALDELCAIEKDGKTIRPKIIASTATVRRADSQIRALFNRQTVDTCTIHRSGQSSR